MSFNIFLYLIPFLILSGNSCKINYKKNNITEGIIRGHSISYEFNKYEMVEDYSQEMWFKDSAVIIKNVSISFELDATEDSKPAFLETLKYVYVNLKNLKCQDYLYFGPNAKIEANYTVKKGEFFPWPFFFENDYIPPVGKTPLIKLSDTLMNGINYKRLFYTGNGKPPYQQRIYYLCETNLPEMLHFVPRIEKLYYPLKALRTEDLEYGKIIGLSYYEIVADSLSEYERSVFNQWAINADTTTLKLQTATEVSENAMYYFERQKELRKKSN